MTLLSNGDRQPKPPPPRVNVTAIVKTKNDRWDQVRNETIQSTDHFFINYLVKFFVCFFLLGKHFSSLFFFFVFIYFFILWHQILPFYDTKYCHFYDTKYYHFYGTKYYHFSIGKEYFLYISFSFFFLFFCLSFLQSFSPFLFVQVFFYIYLYLYILIYFISLIHFLCSSFFIYENKYLFNFFLVYSDNIFYILLLFPTILLLAYSHMTLKHRIPHDH